MMIMIKKGLLITYKQDFHSACVQVTQVSSNNLNKQLINRVTALMREGVLKMWEEVKKR